MSEWTTVEEVAAMPPFLMYLVSADDHWCFMASNGGLTAGRGDPDLALYPYVTQDKVFDTAGVTGSLTLVRSGDRLWRPFDPLEHPSSRTLRKRVDGTQIRFEERNPDLGLSMQLTWGLSQRLGFVRRCELRNTGRAPITVDLLDGLQNLQPCGVTASFANQTSVLVDAYKRAECDPRTGLRIVYLSSKPTDRAEPSECLRANIAWTAGVDSRARLVGLGQLRAFEEGRPVVTEDEVRGERAACLDHFVLSLAPGEARTWCTVAEVGLSTARVSHVQRFLEEHDDDARLALIDEELVRNSARLTAMVAAADGLQLSADTRRQDRHFSNVMFNIMRGGIFIDGTVVPRSALRRHLDHFRPALTEAHAAWLETLPLRIPVDRLSAEAAEQGDPDLERLVTEALPLTFSRRHGDPSRPWNHFSIQVRDARSEPRLSYQGNWRDIFQNWEALVHSFPSFTEGTITRFLNASTADGHNPYRLTSDGFDWEVPDPAEPWSNIGYWGDHQIIYLLRLLEASRRFHPGRLDRLLERDLFTYARVPYRLAPYDELVAHPRDTITYDHDEDSRIAARVEAMGADGKLLPGPDGGVLHVNLAEKLLVPLLAKLANFVPGGGIWMNTQRPEWNDANNALVGFGVSVVTLASCHRYVRFLQDWWASLPDTRTFDLSVEVAALLRSQAEVFADDSDRSRRAVMDALGRGASDYRVGLYAGGLSGERTAVSVHELRAWLADSRRAMAASLLENQRQDGLFHSYNLLIFDDLGQVRLRRLSEMLEGQVAVLSARLLTPRQAASLMDALAHSALRRADLGSYLLYPDRDLPRFLDKNRIAPSELARSPLLQALARDPDQDIVEEDADGALRFGGDLRNGAELREALTALPESHGPLVEAHGKALVAHFEDLFDHHAFTGRSGTFFAYEGLGSIYWHMVSKLVLAVQEQALAAARAEDPAAEALALAFEDSLEGLGMHLSPKEHGAVPTDAYSHTPKHAGAQQPGMTGQVKEDILVRWGELGVRVREGRLSFRPQLLRADELVAQATVFTSIDVGGAVIGTPVPAGGLAFTFCQVPVVYRRAETARLRVEASDGRTEEIAGTALSLEQSQAVFARTGAIVRLWVDLPGDWFRGSP